VKRAVMLWSQREAHHVVFQARTVHQTAETGSIDSW
jgi:hypothetical protein